jgi:tripartite-type tricarboxylate transporter receptor subunit TctC
MDELADRIGQPIVSDFRGGGGATIGTYLATQAVSDGYTMLFSLNALTISAAIRDKLKYDPLKDLAPVSLMLRSSSILVVHPSIKVSSVKELVAFANSSTKAMTYGSQGVGTSAHMLMELLKHATGMRLTHIPYSGGGPASTALLSGEVKTMILASSFGTPLIKSGKLHPLATTASKRLSTFPDLPTMAEAGVPGADKQSYSGWWGILMPAKTPAPAINKISSELNKVVMTTKMMTLAEERGFESVGSTPQEFAKVLRMDLETWKQVAKAAGIKAN